MAYTFENIIGLTSHMQSRLLARAELLEAYIGSHPDEPLNIADCNELAAAAVLLLLEQGSHEKNKKPYKWAKIATAGNDKLGRIALAYFYFNNTGTPNQNAVENDKEAFKLFSEAIKEDPNDVTALNNLAFMYENARGTPPGQAQSENKRIAQVLFIKSKTARESYQNNEGAFIIAAKKTSLSCAARLAAISSVAACSGSSIASQEHSASPVSAVLPVAQIQYVAAAQANERHAIYSASNQGFFAPSSAQPSSNQNQPDKNELDIQEAESNEKARFN